MNEHEHREDTASVRRRAARGRPVETDAAVLRADLDARRADRRHLGDADVLALQRVAGNRATSTDLARPPATVQRIDTETIETVDKGTDLWNQGSGTAGAITTIGTTSSLISSNNGNLQQTVNSGAGLAGGIAGVTSLYGMGRNIQDLTARKRALKEAKTQGNDRLTRTRKRKVGMTGGDLTTNTGSALNATSATVSGVMGVAGTASTVANTTGVVGATIAAPIQVFALVRSSRRAELQRQRMNRVQKLQKAGQLSTVGTNPEQLMTTSMSEKQKSERLRDDAKRDLDQTKTAKGELEQKLGETKTSMSALESQLSDLDTHIAEEERELENLEGIALIEHQQALGQLTGERRALAGDLARKRSEIGALETEIKEHEDDIAKHQAEHDEHSARAGEHSDEAERGDAMKTQMATSGHLDDQGKAEMQMPSLQEINDYAVKKNKRGFARRTIGAVGAGIGVAGGAVGIAAAVEMFKGNTDTANDLGVAAAVIGGVAALAGIGVGIWKAVRWGKKRKAQARKMAAANGGQAPKGTYNPFKKTVDHQTERRHYATALLTYATHGTEAERAEAAKIMAALDPKGPWARKDPASGELAGLDPLTPEPERKELVDHFMDKMGSGG